MSERHDDDLLREEFGRLRAQTSDRVPDFGAMMERARADAAAGPELTVSTGGAARARPRRRALLIGGWASAAVAAAVAALLLVDGRPDADAEFERLVASYTTDVAGGWRSPTSSLLEVPGMSLTRSVPTLGEPARGLDPSTRPERDPRGRDS